MNYYPAFLNLKGKKAVVIGGGTVAERKVFSLLDAGADVTVISPSLTARLTKKKSSGAFRHLARNYRKSDLRGAFITVAATGSPDINSRVSREAPALVNVVDVPALCNFIVPSTIRRGPLVIAISTAGVSPALSKALRMELEEIYGREFARYLRFLGAIRAKALASVPPEKRRTFLRSLASKKVIGRLREEGFEAVREDIKKRLRLS